MLSFIFPTADMERLALDFRQEFFDNGESEVHGDGALYLAESYSAWLEKINLDLTRDDVPAATYFAFSGDKIVGSVQIRYRLDAYFSVYGGHIGFSVRPSERRKGYAGEILAWALAHCRARGLKKVMVTCEKDNIASARTIEKNGGVLESEIWHPDGVYLQRRWITL